MSILTTKQLPNGSFSTKHGIVNIKTGFKQVLKYFNLQGDFRKSDYRKISLTLQIFIDDEYLKLFDSEDVELAMGCINRFVSRSDLDIIYGVSLSEFSSDNSTTKYFDFAQDSDLIYSAFMQTYNIDLCDNNIHWYKFLSLFKGLPKDTKFSELLDLRNKDLEPDDQYNRKYNKELRKLKHDCRVYSEQEIRNKLFGETSQNIDPLSSMYSFFNNIISGKIQ